MTSCAHLPTTTSPVCHACMSSKVMYDDLTMAAMFTCFWLHRQATKTLVHVSRGFGRRLLKKCSYFGMDGLAQMGCQSLSVL